MEMVIFGRQDQQSWVCCVILIFCVVTLRWDSSLACSSTFTTYYYICHNMDLSRDDSNPWHGSVIHTCLLFNCEHILKLNVQLNENTRIFSPFKIFFILIVFDICTWRVSLHWKTHKYVLSWFKWSQIMIFCWLNKTK